MAGKKFKQRKTDVIQDGIVYRMNNDPGSRYHDTYYVYTYTDDLPEKVIVADRIGDRPVTYLDTKCFYRSECREAVIPETIRIIHDYAFGSCKNLENVFIPNSIVNVNSDAFTRCPNLKFAAFSHGLYLGNSENPYLVLYTNERIDRPDNGEKIVVEVHPDTKIITSIAFNNACEKTVPVATIDKLIIHDKLAYRGGGSFCLVFGGLERISEVYVDSVESIYKVAGNIAGIGKRLFIGGEEVGDTWVFPETISEIGYDQFSHAACLKNVVFEGNITKINYNTFYGCQNLSTAVFEGDVAEIKSDAFGLCYNLKKIVFKKDAKVIASSAFGHCPNLTLMAPAGGNIEEHAKDRGFRFEAI
jgi:hypothetical protein